MPSRGPIITWLTVEAGQYLSGLNFQGDGDFLSPHEREKFAGLRFSRRISGWLLGRRAAKTLLKSTCPDLAYIPETAITIANNPAGAPCIQVDGRDHYPGCLSITHRRNLALAAYCPSPGWKIGIDLEIVEDRHESFLLDYFTPAEVAAAHACAGESRSLWITLAWSVKESALKALGTGLRLDTRSIEVGSAPGLNQQPGTQPPGWQKISLSSDLFPAGSGCAWWQQRGDFVLTVAVISPDGKAITQNDICLLELSK